MGPNGSLSSSLSLNEQRWLQHISQNFIIDIDIHPCVFGIPESEKERNPEAYAPKKFGLGPYQHFQQELHPRESQKRAAAKKFLKPHQFLNFKDLVVRRLIQIEPTIRACYNRYVDLDGNSLAWVMAIDSVFLLHFFSIYFERKDKGLAVDSSLEELARDVLVLENQIPIIILQEILTALQISTDDNNAATDYPLFDHFYRFCEEQSPLELADPEEIKNDHGPKHLLHYMYLLIVKNHGEKKLLETQHQAPSAHTTSQVTATAAYVISQGKEIVQEAVNEVNSAINHATSSGIKVPGKVQTVSRILQTVQKSLTLRDKSENRYESNYMAEEIDVPTVAQLSHIAKITFKLTPGGIGDIRLEKGNVLYLPAITLRANSDVVLRNLLAYEEATAEPGSTLELADYVDLMCGIVDTYEDIYLLKHIGIIKGDLTDEEMLKIFNGFNKSTGKSHVKSSLEKIADQVSKQFHHIGIVKLAKCIRNGFDSSKTFLKHLITVMLFLVLAFQLYREFRGLLDYEAAGPFGLLGTWKSGLASQANLNQAYSQEM